MKTSTISLLIKRQFRENHKVYGIGLLVLFILLLFMFVIVHQWQDSFSGAVQNGVFIIGLFIGGAVFTNSMFQEFSSPQSAMWLLSIPAKHSEKTISTILISTIFFLIIYIITFYVADVLYLLFTSSLNFETILNPFKNNFHQFFFIYFLFNGLILLGSVIFNKHSLIKTLLATAILFIGLNYCNNLILGFLISDETIVSSIPFDSFLFSNKGENVKVFLFEKADLFNSIFIRGIIPIAIWLLVWLKLKEKEI